MPQETIISGNFSVISKSHSFPVELNIMDEMEVFYTLNSTLYSKYSFTSEVGGKIKFCFESKNAEARVRFNYHSGTDGKDFSLTPTKKNLENVDLEMSSLEVSI